MLWHKCVHNNGCHGGRFVTPTNRPVLAPISDRVIGSRVHSPSMSQLHKPTVPFSKSAFPWNKSTNPVCNSNVPVTSNSTVLFTTSTAFAAVRVHECATAVAFEVSLIRGYPVCLRDLAPGQLAAATGEVSVTEGRCVSTLCSPFRHDRQHTLHGNGILRPHVARHRDADTSLHIPRDIERQRWGTSRLHAATRPWNTVSVSNKHGCSGIIYCTSTSRSPSTISPQPCGHGLRR